VAELVDLSEYYPPRVDKNEISKAHAVVKKILSPSAVSVDEIIRSCQLSSPVVASALLKLKLAGLLGRHPGNRVSTIQEL
jgi:DNA processing protein